MADRSERSRITAHLASHPKTFVLFATASAFACYFCTYAFRKPFSAATFEGVPLFLSFDGRTLEPKTLFVIAQIFGYCVSKFIGTRLCAELRREDLAKALIITVLLGMLALLGFATLPLPLKVIAFFVMIVMALLFLIRKNRTALAVSYGIMISGLAMMGGSTWLYQSREISGEMWMIASGLGAYLAYVPFGSLLFDRTIAVTRFQGTAVFAIYVADALGYTGSVGVQLYKDLFAGDESRLDFFMNFTYGMAAVGIPLMGGAMIYFLGQKPEPEPATDA